MAEIDDIKDHVRELTKVIGLVFYVTNKLDKTTPEHYPLWVAVQHGMNLIEELSKILEMEVERHEGLH